MTSKPGLTSVDKVLARSAMKNFDVFSVPKFRKFRTPTFETTFSGTSAAAVKRAFCVRHGLDESQIIVRPSKNP